MVKTIQTGERQEGRRRDQNERKGGKKVGGLRKTVSERKRQREGGRKGGLC